MPALGITYATKEFGGKPKTVHTKQWWFDDANEVRDAINNHKDLFDGVAVVGNAFKADSFVKTGATAGDVLLGDGTTTTLSSIGQQTLQEVTDLGATTTNAVTTGGLTITGQTPGQDLLVATTFGGQENFKISETETTINNNLLKILSSEVDPNASITRWINNGIEVVRIEAEGEIACKRLTLTGSSTMDVLSANRAQVNSYRIFNTTLGTTANPIFSNNGAVSTGIYFPKLGEIAISVLDTYKTHWDENGGLLLGLVADTIDASAKFQLNSTTKGSIPFPRMTQAQRTAIATPATGLHVYQTDGTEGVYVNKSTGWVLAY